MKRIFRTLVTYAIQYEAKLVLKKYKPNIVTIVGSVGKTTTKDAVYSVLSQKYFVRKSEKSFNSEIGVPLTILGLQNAWSNPFLWAKNIVEGLFLLLLKNNYPEWLVLEVGADHPGDIQKLSKWIESDIAILTRLPDVPVHVEYFPSVEDVIKEKASIVESLKREGTLILNGDDEKILELAKKHQEKNIITYGHNKENEVQSLNYGISTKDRVPQGIRFNVRRGEENLHLEIHGALGRGHLYPALAACSVGFREKLTIEEIEKGFDEYVPPKGRMRILKGIKNTTIIDDTYNSSPIAVEEALNVLSSINPKGRKIVALGDMMELGKFSIEEHKKIGMRVKEVADKLITVGFRARGIAEGALNMSMHPSKILQYEDARRAGKELESILKEGDVVLAKASQSIRLEKLVGEIMAEPDRKSELLVRQDIEWLKR
jgi:UDP-N-acetylmuramoyl-tripeptide--D-alanyl-D-alanine ligase